MPLVLPADFQHRMQNALGSQWAPFEQALHLPPPVSVRYHFLKETKLPEIFDKVKWSSKGVYLTERPIFTLDPALHAGAYYVQEASSMLVEEAVRQLCDLDRPLRVLDLAAAPGGKSTLLADLLGMKGLLLANEVIRPRYQVLRHNLARWGYPNAHSSNHDSRDLGTLGAWFDLLLLDAPCSGEGLFRKDPEAALEWSPEALRLCTARQRRILADAAGLLRPGGILIYSTCTYHEEENAENVRWMAREFGFEEASLHIPAEWGVQDMQPGYQCYPHRVRGEGFYVACLRKAGESPQKSGEKAGKLRGWEPLPPKWLPQVSTWVAQPEEYRFFIDAQQNVRALPKSIEPWTTTLSQVLNRMDWGLEVGSMKGQDLVPAPELALSLAVSKELPAVALDRTNALLYLKKEPISIPDAPQGWMLVRYQGLNLGWAKVLKDRVNNYYPKNWRIRMDIPL
jgi:16S rRNA C967 or C1407 C5-methylase (RsmB/RsmF family)/NOL1/NOP2/fmu family ribosome biogenesis protein